MARLSVIEQEPKIGRPLNDLVLDKQHTDFFPLDDASELDRLPFFYPDRPEPGIGPCGQHMLSPAFRRYRTEPVTAFELTDVYVIGGDGVIVTGDGVLRNTLEHVSTWRADSCVEQIRRKDYMKLRRQMPVTAFVAQGRHVIGFNGAWHNHGHWLAQCLPRLHAFTLLRRRFRDMRVVLPPLAAGSAQQRTLDLLGIGPDAVHTLDPGAVTGFASAIVLPSFDIWSVSPFVVAAADALLASLPEEPAGATVRPDKVYVHRSVRTRNVANFAAVYQVLEQYGFAARSFETMDFAEQIRTMRAAGTVLSEHGAGTANLMFCAAGARVLELFSPFAVQPQFWSLASRRGVDYGFIVGSHSPTEADPLPNWNAAYEVPLGKLEDGIRAALRMAALPPSVTETSPAPAQPPAPPPVVTAPVVTTVVPPAHSAPAPAAAPHIFGGILEPIFEIVSGVARFATTGGHERFPIFAAAMPAAGLPPHREAELPRDFVADHTQYTAPASVAAYAISGASLWGNGIITVGSQFVAPLDVVPGHFRGNMREGGAPLHPSQVGALGRPDAGTVAFDHPIASVLHPNLLFGHFLVEILPRLYLLSVLHEFGAGIPLALSTTVPAWVKPWVRMLVADDRIVWYDGATQRATAPSIVLPGMMHTDNSFHPALNLMVRDLVQRLPPLPPGTPPTPTLVYLARAHYGNEKLENAAEVEGMMAGMGFAVVRPADLTAEQLIRLFAGARTVVAEYGFGLYATMFCAPGTRVVSINFANNAVSKIARVRRHRMSFVPPADGQFRHWRLGTKGLSPKWPVDVALLRQTTQEMLEAR